MSTGKELPRKNCPSPDSCGWSKKDMRHFQCPREDCKYSAREEGKSTNDIDDQETSAAKSVKKKKNKKKKKRPQKVDDNDESINRTLSGLDVASEEGLKIPLPEGKPSLSSVAKDDKEAPHRGSDADEFSDDKDHVACTLGDRVEDWNPEQSIFVEGKASSTDHETDEMVIREHSTLCLDKGIEAKSMNTIDDQKASAEKSVKKKKKKKKNKGPEKADGNDERINQAEAKSMNDIDDQKASAAKSVKKKKKKKKNKGPEKADGNDERINQAVATEEGQKVTLLEEKPLPPYVTKDDEEAPHRLAPSSGDSDDDQNTSTLKSEKKNRSPEKADGNDERINRTETSFEFLIILDELLLDILKASGEQSMDVQRLEKEVLDRTGCDFSTLYEIIKGTEQGSHGVEDFILKDSNFFELKDSMVRSISQFSPHRLGEKIDLDFSRQHISSCRNFVDWCLLPARDARSIVLAYCTIGDKTWPFGVLDLLLWFCPLLEEVDLTGCVCLRRSNFIKSPPPCRVIDHECLSPSYLLNSDDAVEKISDMLSHDHLSFSLHSNGWTLLHSAVLLGSQELVKSFFAHYKTIGNDNYFKSVHFKTARELAITLHRCDILELFKEISPLEDMSPSLFLHLCFYPKHGMTKFKHPFEIVTSNKDALRITEKLHAIQDCNLTRLLQTYLRELDITFKEEMLKKLMTHLEEYTRPDNSYPNNPCWNDREVCEAVKILVKETGCSVHGKVEGFPYLMLSMPNVQLAEFFIQEGVRIDEKDQLGHTCLFHAVEKAIASNLPERWYNFITFLLKNKANPNERDDLSETPLLYSLSYLLSSCSFGAHRQPDAHYPAYGNYSGIQAVKTWSLLLEAKARPNVKDENDRSLLHVLLSLLKTGHLTSSQGREIVCKGIPILEKYEMKINSSDSEGNTALHMWASLMLPSISDEMIKIGSEIVSHGGNVNSRNNKGDTPFHMLVKESFAREDLVEPNLWSRILALGMNPWIANYDGKCPFEVLLGNESFGSAFTFLKAIFEDDQNRDMAESARRYRNMSGDYLLHTLCIVNNENVLEICEYLLVHGCEVNVQNECKQTPLHLLCNKVSETDSSLSQQTIDFTRLLERYNADMTLSDIYGNTCKDMLSKYQRLKIPKTTKWISESIVHKAVLSEVVLGKNSQNVENYHYHTRPIGKGTFSCVFPAINKMDGREVALKRLEKARLAKTEGMLEREISCLLKLSSCPNVVNYITCTRDSNFEYIVIELMEGSLDNYLSSTKVRSQALTICSQIALGMKFLHGSDVLHRDLKPQNILYRTKPEFIVKLSDFGLSKFLQQTSTDSKSVMHSKAGTRCWMAPELLAQTHEGHSKATDIYSCGILFHYVVSGKKHPFSSSDKSLKSNLHEIEQNIHRNKMHLCSSLSPEAFHLITEMLSKDPESRPTASSLRKFPFFWDDCRKVEFLKSVGDLKEFKEPRIGLLRKLSGVESKLETFFSDHFHATIHWSDAISNIYDDLMFKWSKRVYDTKSAVELVRFIRNAYVHADILEKKTRKDYLEKFVVLKIFPYLVTDVYKAIKGYSSWKNRKDMKQFF